MVEYLVSFGFYYKPEDIKKLMEPLMSLIDGRNDKPYPNVTGKLLSNTILMSQIAHDLNVTGNV